MSLSAVSYYYGQNLNGHGYESWVSLPSRISTENLVPSILPSPLVHVCLRLMCRLCLTDGDGREYDRSDMNRASGGERVKMVL